jgi:hypothetical protein
LTWNDRVTSGALPCSKAVTVHVPVVTVVTVESVTVHTDGVSELNSTGSPDDACANRATGVPTVTPGGWSNVIAGVAGA